MRCPFCKNALTGVDKYRMYCAVCAATFTKELSCPECSMQFLQIIEANKFVCLTTNCPSRNPRHFSLPYNLSHLKNFFVPYQLPSPEPKMELRIDRTEIDSFTFMKFWREDKELDVVVEFSKPFKHSSELTWEWDDKKSILTVYGASDQTKDIRAELPLDELREETLVQTPHAQKTVSRLLVVTFLLS